MLPSDKVIAKLRSEEIDLLVATTRKNVFYTTGVWTTPTVTPGEENYQKTGHYTDYVPPKSVGIWSAEGDGPIAVVPPVVAMDIADENVDLDIADENVYVFEQKRAKVPDDSTLSEHDRRAIDLLSEGFADRSKAIAAALSDLIDSGSHVAVEDTVGSEYVKSVIEGAVGSVSFSDATQCLQEMRLQKTDEEIQRLRRAAEINKQAIETAVGQLEEGMTERELATIYKTAVYDAGAIEQQPIEHTMIGFGPHSAYPHVVPGDRELRAGDLVRFEVGCRYEHYPADLARTFVFKESDPELEAIYSGIKAGMEQAANLLSDHRNAADVHAGVVDRVQAMARERGIPDLEDFTMTMIGHNIGLDMHDPPLLSNRRAPIEPGYVMNYELSHKMFGRGTVQLEDTVAVTSDGIERFTEAPESLPVIE